MEFITKITQLMPVDRIYISQYDDAQAQLVKELIIVLPRSSKIHTAEAKPLINMVMADYPQYVLSIFTVQDIKRALHYGSMYFFMICKENNLLYQSEGMEALLPADMTAKSVLKKATRSFEQEWKKIKDFGAGFQFYFDQDDYAPAAFMLHQVMELSYRTVELLVIGKEKVTHSIRNHQKTLKPYVKELGAVFNEDDEDEMALLSLLEEAYRSVRYELDYKISQDQLQQLCTKANLLKALVWSMYDQIVSDFTKEAEAEDLKFSVEASNSKSIATQETIIKQITAKIADLVPILRIYKLARHAKVDYRSGMCAASEEDPVDVHYYLLVICNTPCGPDVFNMQGLINQDKNINATVTLLTHSLKDVQEALHDSQVFFHELLREGELIHGTDSFAVQIPELDASRVGLYNAQLWYNRYNRAKALMEAAANVTEEENGIVMANMLSQAMVQLCLVYIAHSIGYRPNQLSLKHLFALCRMIDPLIDEVFPISREEDRRLFDVLLDADKTLRYKTLAFVDITDQCVLLRRCNAWMEKVGLLREEGKINLR